MILHHEIYHHRYDDVVRQFVTIDSCFLRTNLPLPTLILFVNVLLKPRSQKVYKAILLEMQKKAHEGSNPEICKLRSSVVRLRGEHLDQSALQGSIYDESSHQSDGHEWGEN